MFHVARSGGGRVGHSRHLGYRSTVETRVLDFANSHHKITASETAVRARSHGPLIGSLFIAKTAIATTSSVWVAGLIFIIDCPRLLLEIDIRQRLAVLILHDVARAVVLDFQRRGKRRCATDTECPQVR